MNELGQTEEELGILSDKKLTDRFFKTVVNTVMFYILLNSECWTVDIKTLWR